MAADLLRRLERGQAHRFSDWPEQSLAVQNAVGAYTIWEDHRYIYAGMAGRNGVGGLYSRLGSHCRTGRRSGNQFLVYIADRIVLRTLTAEQMHGISDGTLSLDALVRDCVRERFSYRYVLTDNAAEARALEQRARCGELTAGRPFLNPLP